MKLTRLRLQDFRCFGSVDFDLTESKNEAAKPLDVVLLVGENGSGKSSVLKAISGEFTNLWSGYGGDQLTKRDIRFGASEAHVAIHWQDQFGVDRRPKDCVVRVTINDQEILPDDEYASAHETKPNAWARLASSPARRSTGIITSFDVFRLIPPKRVVGPNNQEVIRHRGELALAPTIFQDGRIRPRSDSLKQWIVNLDYLRTKAKADRQQDLPIWGFLHTAFNTLLHPYTFDKVDENFDVIFRTPTGHVPLEALSDGFRSIFVIITDLLLRLSLATDDPESVLEQEATCLVDEIDAHLHPKWQETIIPGLRAMFPNVQFICTTHSEIVVSTVEPKNVFRLGDGDGYSAIRQDLVFKPQQRSSVSIAEEVFEGQAGTNGRQWILDPPHEVQLRFWAHFKDHIDPEGHAFIAEGPIFLEHLRDIREEALPNLKDRSGRSALFFIDKNPKANWAHPCTYVIFPEAGEPFALEHDWPPSETIRLVPATPIG
jgi:hypothetical protein